MKEGPEKTQIAFVESPDQFFSDLVRDGFERRKIKTYPAVQSYIVNLLKFYLDARNLFTVPSTLAELYLTAANAEPAEKMELLRQLGDRALYISGFFGDSLSRKIVDIDYYAEMGGAAYGSLAESIREDTQAQIYRVFSKQFLSFVDVLADISQSSFIQSDESILRLYDRYLRTGSSLAKEKLTEIGIMTIPADQAKLTRQD